MGESARPTDLPPPPSILVVVREEDVAQDIRSSLLRLGYQVAATATGGSEAIDAVETHRPNVLLMDVSLEQGDDGIAAAAAIRKRHPTPIIFLTTNLDDQMLSRAQEQVRPSGYIRKRCDDGELRAALEVALQMYMREEENNQERMLLAGVLGGMSDAVAAVDTDGKLVLANEAWRRGFGAPTVVTEGQTNDRDLGIYASDCETPCRADELPLARALTGEFVHDAELFIRATNRTEGQWYSVNATPLCNAEGLLCGAVAVGRDVTGARSAHSELQQLSDTDALTGVYNRRGFMRMARASYEIAHQSGHQPSVFFIDLNGMKRINDSLGHPEGDRLLVDVSSILRRCFRTSDVLGRLGGDEFVVLAPEAGEHAQALRDRLRAAVEDFNVKGERPYRISVSIGLAMMEPGDPVVLEKLVEQADQQMYEDKLLRRTRRSDVQSATRILSLSAASRSPALRPLGLSPGGPSSEGPLKAATPKRLLLVDDEPSNVALLERSLAPLGHEIVRAYDGPAAIAAFAACKPDLVLLDLGMPRMNGIEVLARIRRNAGGDHVPVIIVTAYAEREHRLRGLEAGADEFLEKPVDACILRVRVSTLLQLKESHDALRQLNTELQQKHTALERLQREQRELTAFVVHDLKNPLATLWSNLEYVRERGANDDPEVERAFDDAAQASKRLRRMIDDLLTLARLDDADFPLCRESVRLSDLLSDVVGQYTRRAAEKNVELLKPRRSNTRINADRALLQRVLENILDNSLRYTPCDGRVGIATKTDGDVEIAVSNTGPPIPPIQRQRIFEKFARLDPSGEGFGGNAGLGLYFCKRVLEALGGNIEVTETREWPTSFVVRLPAVCR